MLVIVIIIIFITISRIGIISIIIIVNIIIIIINTTYYQLISSWLIKFMMFEKKILHEIAKASICS